MFWTEEDIVPAILSAEKIFGKQNLYHNDPSYKFVSIITGEFGKIWTGEIDEAYPADIQNKLNILSDTLNKQIFITDGVYYLDSALYQSNTKLQETSDFTV